MANKGQNTTLRYRFNSVFFRTFWLVMMVCSLLIGSFLLYFVANENRRLRRDTDTSTRDSLRTSSMATELTLDNLQQLMNQTIWEKEFTSAMVTPNRENYARTSAILTRLRQIAQDYSYILKAFLYIPTDETVYSSDQSYMQVESSGEELFRHTASLKQGAGSRLTDSRESLFILDKEGRIYLCQNLYPDYVRSIGMLIFEIDPAQVKAGGGPEAYSIYDSQGVPVLSTTDTRADSALGLINEQPVREEGSIGTGKNGSCYYYRSARTGWLYLLVLDAGKAFIGWKKVVGLLAAAVLLGLFFAFQASTRINRPVRRLLNEVASSHPGDVDAKNEFDYLSQVYRSRDEENRELQQALQAVAPMALERLFAHVLSGHAPSSEDIEKTLVSLGNPLPDNARFMVICVDFLNSLGERLPALEFHLSALKQQEKISMALPEDCRLIPVYKEEGLLALVLVFPPEKTEEEIRQIAAALSRVAVEGVQEPYRTACGCGNIYDRACDAQYSYREAAKSLARRKFYGLEQAAPEDSELPVRNSWFELSRDLIRQIQSGSLPEAREMAARTLDEIFFTGSRQAEETERFLMTLLQAAEMMQAADIRDLEAECSVFCAGISDRSGEEVRAFCFRLLDGLEQKYSRRAPQHIERIREYLQENYSDSSLSLEMAAEYAGISASYLSRLFRQSLQVSFVDYLNGLRTARAKELLVSTDLLVKDIAYQTGFNSLQSFFRIFKKHTGMSPGDYRMKAGHGQP